MLSEKKVIRKFFIHDLRLFWSTFNKNMCIRIFFCPFYPSPIFDRNKCLRGWVKSKLSESFSFVISGFFGQHSTRICVFEHFSVLFILNQYLTETNALNEKHSEKQIIRKFFFHDLRLFWSTFNKNMCISTFFCPFYPCPCFSGKQWYQFRKDTVVACHCLLLECQTASI